jgi:hypothetical protein
MFFLISNMDSAPPSNWVVAGPLMLDLLRCGLALFAIGCSVILCRRQRTLAWLLIGAVFLEPFVYGIDFPFLYLSAVIGLFLLVQSSRTREAKSPPL